MVRDVQAPLLIRTQVIHPQIWGLGRIAFELGCQQEEHQGLGGILGMIEQ